MANVPYDVGEVLRPARVLIIVPPFAFIDRPSLGVHLLQGVGRRLGVDVQVLYANMLFAGFVGHGLYEALSNMSYSLFMGERLFARAAFGVPPMGYDNGEPIDEVFAAARLRDAVLPQISTHNLLNIEARIDDYLDSFVPAVAAGGYDVIGCTTSFEQTAASLAILAGVKRYSPGTLTILGGPNCEGEMAEGLAELSSDVDWIFAGESEETFATFLEGLLGNRRPSERILIGKPCMDLDGLPPLDYADYYAQLQAFVPNSRWQSATRINFETSRGCWWGQKNHCTFCGLNGQGMTMREKSPDRVIAELEQLLARHPNRDVMMTDNIMPHSYWKTLVPRLPVALPDVHIMYEQKANLSLRNVTDLAAAGIREIQPGIEALSTGLLRLMDKGTTCAQNLALLRYARANLVGVIWNLLTGFPNDQLVWYEETLELIPFLHHLPPPGGRNQIVIDRFAPYHSDPDRYGISELRPYPAYREWLPASAPAHKIAYHFEGTYTSEGVAHPEIMEAIDRALEAWGLSWLSGERSELDVRQIAHGYELVDTRGLPRLPRLQRIDEDQAISALVARSLTSPERAGDAWARSQRVVVERDRKLVPLATASPALLAAFEERFRRSELAVIRSAS